MVPETVWRALCAVEGLRIGEAIEMPPVKAVSDERIVAIIVATTRRRTDRPKHRPKDRPIVLVLFSFLIYIHVVMKAIKSAKDDLIESVQRIEPARLEEVSEAISDVVAELSAASAKLAHALNPRTAANLAGLVRIMNTYYSNLIEGHNTRPRDIERALAGNFEGDKERRNLQAEAVAHVRVQAEVDLMQAEGRLPEPASTGIHPMASSRILP